MITNYATLQTAIANWLNRSDLTTAIPEFIQIAEARFRADERCRKLEDGGAFVISADGEALPSDLMSIESWYHDGPTYFGPIDVVPANELGARKGSHPSGAPAAAALIDGLAYFAPAPDGAYNTRMTYWRTVEPLGVSTSTNWLLDDHPDVYLFGALAETAPFLKDDERVALWETKAEAALNRLSKATQNKQFGGSLRRSFRPIG